MGTATAARWRVQAWSELPVYAQQIFEAAYANAWRLYRYGHGSMNRDEFARSVAWAAASRALREREGIRADMHFAHPLSRGCDASRSFV